MASVVGDTLSAAATMPASPDAAAAAVPDEASAPVNAVIARPRTAMAVARTERSFVATLTLPRPAGNITTVPI
jgi:hypothetical protein